MPKRLEAKTFLISGVFLRSASLVHLLPHGNEQASKSSAFRYFWYRLVGKARLSLQIYVPLAGTYLRRIAMFEEIADGIIWYIIHSELTACIRLFLFMK